MTVDLFHALVVAHIITGSVGLFCMWIPIVGRKGGASHKRWGKVFAWSMITTGCIAIGISICTLIAPLETHPFSDDADMVRGIFGWMMLYLATMTIMLARYGLLTIRFRTNHIAMREPLNLLFQGLTFIAAVNCLVFGVLINQPLMFGISIVGIAAAILNTRYCFQKAPPVNEWQIQHSRGLVGAGISVYTAFLAFGAVNLLPEYALNPALWMMPTLLGVTYLLYHQFRISKQRARLRSA
jgi:hypothetical protein